MCNNLTTLLIRTSIVLLGLCDIGNAQTIGDDFVNFKFDSTRHEVRLVKSELKNYSVIVTIVKDKQNSESDVWLKESLKNGQMKEKYLGQTNTEFAFYVPTPQPLENCYLFAVCGESNCNFIYLNENGDWIEFPGHYFAISKDKKYLYTKTESDGENIVSKLDLNNNKFVTKEYINQPNNDTWEGVANEDYYKPKATDWLR